MADGHYSRDSVASRSPCNGFTRISPRQSAPRDLLSPTSFGQCSAIGWEVATRESESFIIYSFQSSRVRNYFRYLLTGNPGARVKVTWRKRAELFPTSIKLATRVAIQSPIPEAQFQNPILGARFGGTSSYGPSRQKPIGPFILFILSMDKKNLLFFLSSCPHHECSYK